MTTPTKKPRPKQSVAAAASPKRVGRSTSPKSSHADAHPLRSLAGRELVLSLPKLGSMSPGLAVLWMDPETHEGRPGPRGART
jgi:hypothetical protein